MTDAPKFWDAKRQAVIEDVQIRNETPTELADILGTYVWVYSGDPQFGGEVEEYRRDYKDDAEFIACHSITVSAANEASEPVTMKNVKGTITWGTAKVAFEGVRRVRERWSKDAAVPLLESYWEVMLIDDGESDAWLDWKGNAVGVVVVVDDNGNPFLVFDWKHPPGCHSSWSGYYLGKRLVEGNSEPWRMTDGERGRLGIGRTSKSVEQEGKEENDGGSDVGEKTQKRKASDGATGANKRVKS